MTFSQFADLVWEMRTLQKELGMRGGSLRRDRLVMCLRDKELEVDSFLKRVSSSGRRAGIKGESSETSSGIAP